MINNTQKQSLFFEDKAWESLHLLIEKCKNQKQKVFVLVDSNTKIYCLPILKKLFDECNCSFIAIEIPSGEKYKTIETVSSIWSVLIDNQADRNSVFVNLGGGVVTDTGGFAASCYKRGICFYNIPTTLLGMIDAAIGGKTGIDFHGYKNAVGLFNEAENVYICSDFLKTLSKEEIRSGLGEMIKYGYVIEPEILDVFKKYLTEVSELPIWIERVARCKKSVVDQDFMDQDSRKILNFGHTSGHAFETLALKNSQNLRHGEAVALGIFVSLKLSEKYCGLKKKCISDYEDIYDKFFLPYKFEVSQVDDLIGLMYQDKKNERNEIKFVLISEVGTPKIDITVSEADIRNILLQMTKQQE